MMNRGVPSGSEPASKYCQKTLKASESSEINTTIMAKSSRNSDLSADVISATEFEKFIETENAKAIRDIMEHRKIPSWLNATVYYKILCRCILQENRAMIPLLLSLHSALEIDAKMKRTATPLWTAVICTDAVISRLLIAAGANVHLRCGPTAKYDPECTMLHYLVGTCCHPERKDLLELMIQHGADINAVDSKGKTPMHYAVLLNDTESVSILLSKGANVNARDLNGYTPLLSACTTFVTLEMAALLVRNGADVFAKTREGCNGLHLLANSRFECPDVAEVFLQYGLPHHVIHYKRMFTALHYAAKNGKAKLAEVFLEYGAHIDGWEGCYMLPLFLATERNSIKMLKTLLAYGANVESNRGKTALHIACKNMFEHNINILLDYGADINALDYEGATPFSLMEYTTLSWSVKLMIRTIAKRTALAKFTNEGDLDIIRQHSILQNYYNECLIEINEMKQLKLYGEIPYFTIFSESLISLTFLLRDSKYRAPLKIKCHGLFKIYNRDFNSLLRNAEILCDDLSYAENNLNIIFCNEARYSSITGIIINALPPHVFI